MSSLLKGTLVTIALLLGGLALTQFVAATLERRAERPVDQAFNPAAP